MQINRHPTRRQWLCGSAAAVAGGLSFGRAGSLFAAPPAPAGVVSIAKCPSYDENLVAELGAMFDQIGGIATLVGGKTVTIKLNLTGSPSLRYGAYAPGVTHYVHPKLVGACCHLLGRAGARRIRLVESCWASADALEEYMLDAGWNLKALESAAPLVEFENTNALGQGKRYSRLKVPHGGYMYPAFDLNHAYEDTDVFMTMAKLKNHATCGVTLSLKNSFGTSPASIYGDDAGSEEPNESPRSGRGLVFHNGKRGPARCSPQELHPDTPRHGGYRVPRIVVDLVAARPIDLQIIDGIESVVGGEGPWIRGSKYVRPGVLIVGANPVSTDAVGAAVMGYDPRADRGTPPFRDCDNTMKLAEAVGIGTTDLARIDVRGVSIKDALCDYEAHWRGKA
ncbi:MAG: DUF362 domain-containing protein [Acidobacteria bacterium]|nr:DUF362 domain-containing protein [Acidobacteriota bacterium]